MIETDDCIRKLPVESNSSGVSAEDLSALEKRIEDRLCELGNLVADQFPVTRRTVVRGGREVGTHYCVHGPRSVKLTAILDSIAGEVIYYGSDGIRKERQPI